MTLLFCTGIACRREITWAFSSCSKISMQNLYCTDRCCWRSRQGKATTSLICSTSQRARQILRHWVFIVTFLTVVVCSQPGAWALESFYQGLRFFCIFEKSGKNETTDLAVSQLRGSAIAIISAHVPGQHMWSSAGQGLSSSSPKQCKSDGCVKIYNSVSARSPLTKSKKKKIIKSAAM